MMNTMSRFALALLPALALISPAPVSSQGATKTLVSATEIPLTLVSPGTVTYPGGNVHVRGRVTIAQWIATDPRANFNATVTTNGNFDGTDRQFETPGDLFAFAACLPENTMHMTDLVGGIQVLDPTLFPLG